jgi:tetratricopeptide (TPR) repeat protein
VDRGVIATASELFECRHYPSVVAVCSDALEGEPGCVPLLLMRARAHMALRRELDAQADLREIIRLDSHCGLAYRLLGELAARRSETESAAIFFREALRLDPGDREAADRLLVVDPSVRSQSPDLRAPPRFARGTHSPKDAGAPMPGTPGIHDERPTRPFARGSNRDGDLWRTPSPVVRPHATTAVLPPSSDAPETTIRGRPATTPPAVAMPRLASRPIARGPTPELPGFGEYLVSSGILTRERLRAAQAYQRSMRVQLSTAIVTLGLATPQRIEWAQVSHQSQLARDRQPNG